MHAFVLRPYGVADAEACAAIFDAAWRVGHPHAPRVIDAGVFAHETTGETIVVAVEQGRLLGFVAVHEPGRFVHHLYVAPAAQGRGVGRALLDRALAHLGGPATLKCQIRNARALAFYQAAGWTKGERGEADGEPWIRLHSPGTPA